MTNETKKERNSLSVRRKSTKNPLTGVSENYMISLKTTKENHDRVMEYAKELGCYAITGPNVGKPSVVAFMRELASGNFIITRKEDA